MNLKVASVVEALTPVIVYGLGLVCPAVPAVVWSSLIDAVLSGDITLAHLQQFLADHNIQTYQEFPSEDSKGQQ